MDMEARVDRVEDDIAEIKADIRTIRIDMQALLNDFHHMRGRLDAMPTTIQLLGFIIAIFVAAGLTRFFGH